MTPGTPRDDAGDGDLGDAVLYSQVREASSCGMLGADFTDLGWRQLVMMTALPARQVRSRPDSVGQPGIDGDMAPSASGDYGRDCCGRYPKTCRDYFSRFSVRPGLTEIGDLRGSEFGLGVRLTNETEARAVAGAVCHVSDLVSEIQMVRADARGGTAGVQYQLSAWDWAVSRFPGEAVSAYCGLLFRRSELTVAAAQRPLPEPTGICFADMPPKTINGALFVHAPLLA